ncbi:MAG TPA: hypothetical protein VJ506_06320 [Candidatus Limnocylindrales bacterium]|nr:hypothetical protein [Candidatus Limnocylindrales bacterium]
MDRRRLAMATGVVGIGSTACLALLFAVGEPFGVLNDVGNGLLGVLSVGLAVALRRPGAGPAAAVGLAGLGAAISVVGSVLVTSGATGFVLAGFVSGVGFACIGLWLFGASPSMLSGGNVSPRVSRLGAVAGLAMVTGIVGLPGIALRLDDLATLPAWAWIPFVGWLGTSILYPIWAIAVGRAAASRSRVPPAVEAGAA